jgi:riboflavin-specific deaminase-like protein
VFVFVAQRFLIVQASTAGDETIVKIMESISGRQAAYFDQFKTKEINRPFVLLTYAQSLDGKIALKDDTAEQSMPSRNYPISGPVSLKMTHALRSMHDGILVGGTTFEVDRPRLTNRLWEDKEKNQPRPIILDTHLTRLEAMNGNFTTVKSPIFCCSIESASSAKAKYSSAEILPCRCRPDGALDLSDVLYRLHNKYGIRTLMVEGGSAVLSSFWTALLFDALCLTISPKFLGYNGFGPTLRGQAAELSASAETFNLGSDIVFITGIEHST